MYLISINTILGKISIISTQKGVARLLIGDNQNDYEPGDPFEAARQIQEYISGKRLQFDLPIDISGTEFQKRVWSAASAISYGQTITYKELAQMTGNQKAARAVGTALSRNPVPVIIPCHRVVGSAGLTGYALGLEIKKILLDLEKSNL